MLSCAVFERTSRCNMGTNANAKRSKNTFKKIKFLKRLRQKQQREKCKGRNRNKLNKKSYGRALKSAAPYCQNIFHQLESGALSGAHASADLVKLVNEPRIKLLSHSQSWLKSRIIKQNKKQRRQCVRAAV